MVSPIQQNSYSSPISTSSLDKQLEEILQTLRKNEDITTLTESTWNDELQKHESLDSFFLALENFSKKLSEEEKEGICSACAETLSKWSSHIFETVESKEEVKKLPFRQRIAIETAKQFAKKNPKQIRESISSYGILDENIIESILNSSSPQSSQSLTFS